MFPQQSPALSSLPDTHGVLPCWNLQRSLQRSRDTVVCAEVHTCHHTVRSVSKHRWDHQCRGREDLTEWRIGRVERIQSS